MLSKQDATAFAGGVVKEQTVQTTRAFEVPFLTNSCDVEEGEELILEVPEKTATRTWKAPAHSYVSFPRASRAPRGSGFAD